MTAFQSGPGYRCALHADKPAFRYDDTIQLQAHLFELEQTIQRLVQHIAELESTIHALENERAIGAAAEERAPESAGPGDPASPGAGATGRSAANPPILFRLEPGHPRARPTGFIPAPTTTGKLDTRG